MTYRWNTAVLGITLTGAVCIFGSGSARAEEAIKLDPNLKSYAKVSGVSGNLNSIGSDTLKNLMTLWAEGFRKQYPNVKIQIEGKGSSTAPPALIEGTAQIGPMSRAVGNSCHSCWKIPPPLPGPSESPLLPST